MDNNLATTKHPRHAGFTIIELMVTLAVAAVLATIAAPNMRDFIRNNRLTSEANDLLRSLQQARSQAIKQQVNVAVCFTANPTAGTPTCSFGAGTGWIVFQDSNANWDHDAGEPLLSTHEFNSGVTTGISSVFSSAITVVSDNSDIVSYAGSGFGNPAGAQTPMLNVIICDDRGNQAVGATNSTARAVLITNTGRARVTRIKTEIDQARTNIGTSLCP